MYSTNKQEETFADLLQQVPPAPELSRSLCVNDYRKVQSFLKFSRHVIDDNLDNNLNHVHDCDAFLKKVVYNEWQKRDRVLEYCQSEVEKTVTEQSTVPDISLEEKNRLMRIDPYSYKARPNTNELARIFNNELQIEKIVKKRSIDKLGDVCNLKTDVLNEYSDYKKA